MTRLKTSAEQGIYVEEDDLGPECSPEELARRVAAAKRWLARVLDTGQPITLLKTPRPEQSADPYTDIRYDLNDGDDPPQGSFIDPFVWRRMLEADRLKVPGYDPNSEAQKRRTRAMYSYQVERPKLFTEDGLTLYVEIRDRVKRLLAEAGAVRADAAIKGSTGDSWLMLACLDRLVEAGELREVTDPKVPGQHRVFVAA